MFKTKKSTILFYVVVCLILCGLSCIGLIFNCYEVVGCMGISALFSFGQLMVCLFYNAEQPKEGENNKTRMYFLIAFRGFFSCMAIIGSFLFLLFTRNFILINISSGLRFLFSLVALVPSIFSLVCFSMWSNKNN